MINFKNLERLHIELTNKCNAACPSCPRNLMGSLPYSWIDHKEMSLTEFRQFFPSKVLKKIKGITFCGSFGDPSLCQDIIDIVRYLEPYELAIQINSNASTRNEEFWFELGSELNEKSSVVFSVDGLADTNSIYRKNTNFEKIVKNIKSYKKSGAYAIWEMLHFAHNSHQVEQVKSLCQELTVNEFRLKNPFGFKSTNDGVQYMPVVNSSGEIERVLYPANQLISSQLEKKIIFAEGKKQARNYLPLPKRAQASHEQSEKISCYAKNAGEIYIDCHGQVFPCCFLSALYPQQDDDSSSQQDFSTYFREKKLSTLSLKYHGLEQILETGPFVDIEEAWGSTSELSACRSYCGEKCGDFSKLYRSSSSKTEMP